MDFLLPPLVVPSTGKRLALILSSPKVSLIHASASGASVVTGNAMRLEISGGCVGYDKVALMRLPVCGAGFLGFLRFQPVAGACSFVSSVFSSPLVWRIS